MQVLGGWSNQKQPNKKRISQIESISEVRGSNRKHRPSQLKISSQELPAKATKQPPQNNIDDPTQTRAEFLGSMVS